MSTKKIKIIFIGTPNFACPILKALINESNFTVAAVITQPDKKTGRRQILTPSPVKEIALEHNLPILQPWRIEKIAAEIKKIQPDLIIVAAYAQILPNSILSIPNFGCLNVHASLLPKYRGAACIQAAIKNGDEKTGVTIMKMDSGLDTGPILAQTSIPITPDDTTDSLEAKLADLGAKLLIPTIDKYLSGQIKPRPQDNNLATYEPALKKEDGKIDWSQEAEKIERLIRAMAPWPGSFSYLNDKIIKILEVDKTPILNDNKKSPGEIFQYHNNLAIQTGKGALIVKKLQLAGEKPITGPDFMRGYRSFIGQILK